MRRPSPEETLSHQDQHVVEGVAGDNGVTERGFAAGLL